MIERDDTKFRRAEQKECQRKLAELDEYLTLGEKEQCEKAFARMKKLPKKYKGIWSDKQKRLHANAILAVAEAVAFQEHSPKKVRERAYQQQEANGTAAVAGPARAQALFSADEAASDDNAGAGGQDEVGEDEAEDQEASDELEKGVLLCYNEGRCFRCIHCSLQTMSQEENERRHVLRCQDFPCLTILVASPLWSNC